nr:uncharacterized protein LOC119182257 [Rhipicephalus microplus]
MGGNWHPQLPLQLTNSPPPPAQLDADPAPEPVTQPPAFPAAVGEHSGTTLYRPVSKKANDLATTREAIGAFFSGFSATRHVRVNFRRNFVAVDIQPLADPTSLLQRKAAVIIASSHGPVTRRQALEKARTAVNYIDKRGSAEVVNGRSFRDAVASGRPSASVPAPRNPTSAPAATTSAPSPPPLDCPDSGADPMDAVYLRTCSSYPRSDGVPAP